MPIEPPGDSGKPVDALGVSHFCRFCVEGGAFAQQLMVATGIARPTFSRTPTTGVVHHVIVRLRRWTRGPRCSGQLRAS
jgi:hypothetical protein